MYKESALQRTFRWTKEAPSTVKEEVSLLKERQNRREEGNK